MKYTVDASNKILGRVACEVVMLLRGKNSEKFLPYRDSGNYVVVTNPMGIKVSGNKSNTKVYFKYSGYPGGIKKMTYEELVKKDTGAALRKAVYGMLASNRLRAKMMRRLRIEK